MSKFWIWFQIAPFIISAILGITAFGFVIVQAIIISRWFLVLIALFLWMVGVGLYWEYEEGKNQ